MLSDKIEGFLFSRFPMLSADGPGSGGGLDGSSDDDPNAPDDDGDDESLESLLGIDGEDESDEDDLEDEPDDEGGEKPGEKGEPEEKKDEPGPKAVVMTQEELDRIIADRLTRDRRVREEQDAQKNEQQRREAEFKQQIDARYNAKVKQLTDLGYDEDSAKAAALDDVQNHIRIIRLENELVESKKQSGKVAAMTRYNADKNEVLSKNPIAAKYVKEIDNFSQSGTVVDFETAMNYVLGQKLASGELMKEIKATTEQKTLANINKRQKTRVEGASQSGKATGTQVELSRTEKLLAKNLGLTEKEYADGKREQTIKKRRTR